MPGGNGAAPQGLLSTSVAAGPAGPLIVLSGEADLSTLTQLSAVITAQLSAGT